MFFTKLPFVLLVILTFLFSIIFSTSSLSTHKNNNNNVLAAVTVPTCRLNRQVYAGDLRTTDNRGVLISVIGDWVNFNNQPDARAIELMNGNGNVSNTEAAYDPTRKLIVESIFLLNDTIEGSLIGINFQQLPDYWLAGRNDTVTIHLPTSFFWSGIPCSTFTFKILPSAGSLDITAVPIASFSEINVNNQDQTVRVYIKHDRFLRAEAWFVNPPNFTISQEVDTTIPALNCIIFTIHRNQSYNPPVGHTDRITIIFNNNMTASGVAPIIGNGVSYGSVSIDITGVEPIASVTYQNPSLGAMRSEDLWDGTAWALLVLEGDTFSPNATLWELPDVQPLYEAAKPVRPYGFDWFFNLGMRPNYTISSRSVNITFPPLEGFTIPEIVDQMKMSEVGRVTNEKRSIDPVPFRVLRCDDSSPIITFTGTPWRNNSDGTIGISEVDVRRTGINITLTIKYNVWTNTLRVREMISSLSFGASTLLRYTDNVGSITDRLRFDLFVPPQTTYDISVPEMMAVTAFSTMTETRQPIPIANHTFNISQFRGASTCSISTPIFIFENDIRNMSGRELNISVNIESGTDQFCFSPQSDLELRQSMSVATGPGNPGPNLVPYIDFLWNSTKNITMRINKWPDFEITSNVYLSVTLPASIMCSIEICVSEQAGGTSSSRLQLPIGATSGQLIGTMPRVSEAYMRTQTVDSVIDFLGDAFSLGTVGSTRGDIALQVVVSPVDLLGRGFLASFPASVRKITIDNNVTRGTFKLLPNKSYDIVKEETISFTIVSVRTASQLSPESLIVPLRIYPLLGELTVVYPNLTALALAQTTTIAAPTTTTGPTLGPNATTDPNATTSTSTTTTTTTSTTTAQPTTTLTGLTTGNYSNTTTTTPGPTFEPWVLNVVESEILNGNVTLNFTLANDRFNTAILPSVVRAQLTRHTILQPSGIDSNKNIILADAAFYFDRDEFFMSIQFRKAPSYDITVPESFSLYINGSVLISEASPLQNTITINVQPDPGNLVMTGDAVLVSSFDIVNGDRSYSITLDGDKFVSNAETLFNYTELCTITQGGCQIKLDASRRNITVTYDPFRTFFISRNQTYTIVLHPWYFDANVVPTGDTNVTVYLSGGKLEWFMTLVSVSEDAVRSGSYPDLAADKPIATALVSGDKFASKEDVRRAIADSVTCVSADPNLAGKVDPYGFCSRAKNLFGSIFFQIREEELLDVVLQPDDAFDIYAEETVTFVIGGGATQSRLQPRIAGKPGVLSIYPTQGKFFISTSFVYITEQDLASPALASKLKLSISLYGERWLANVTRVVEVVAATMISNLGTKEINGWTRYRSTIVPAKTAGTIDATGRLLELQFVAATKYDVFNPETITVGVPASAVLSEYAPTLRSVQSGFTIDTVGGILTGQALQTKEEVIPGATAAEDLTILVTNVITPTVSVMQTVGFNITLQLSRDTWDEVNLYSDWSLVYNAFSSSKTPQEEGHGFAVYKEEILKPKDVISPVPGNGTHRFFLLNPVANYDLVNPERLRVDLALFWTQQGNGGKATTPSYFEILIMPEFPFVEAAVKSYEDLTDTTNAAAQAYIENWKNQVADKLAIIPSRIEIISIDKEWMVPDAAPYFRIRFKVTDVTDPDIPYDNTFTRLFTSWDRPFLESNFNVSFAFFNASPPEVNQWRTVEGGGGLLDTSEAVGASLLNILWFVCGIIVALFVVFLLRRYQQGRHKNGLNWGESDGRKKAAARFSDSHDKEEENFDKAAELLFTGQRELVPYLADDTAAKAAKVDAARAAHAAKHGIVRQQTATQVLGDPSAQGYRLRTARPTTDGRDELAFFDIDENIYSGQKATHKRATDADVGMSLIDRMVTSGTDHSTRISKTGASRLANLTDLMSPREVEMTSTQQRGAAYGFVSPTEVKTRDPVLFGSERRINDLLDRVGSSSPSSKNSGYMTDLRSQLLDTGINAAAHKAIYNDNAANEQKLWNDKKADEVMLPPHLVGKVNRFRAPNDRK